MHAVFKIVLTGVRDNDSLNDLQEEKVLRFQGA